MGVVASVTRTSFPKQGSMLDQRVKVVFHYDFKNFVMGTVVRDDVEEPNKTIIKLDDGRYVLGTECQYG